MGELAHRYRDMVENGSTNFSGLTVVHHAPEIGALMTRHWARTALDVGCGRGEQYREPYNLQFGWGLESVTLYDPAFADHNKLPPEGKTFDAVICSDVLEHIPEHELDEFIGELFKRADKFVWMSVCCRKAKKEFPGGGNLHVTVKGINWWNAKVTNVARAVCVSRFGHIDALDWHLIQTL